MSLLWDAQARGEGGLYGVSYPEPRDVWVVPPSLKNIKYITMRHIEKQNSNIFLLRWSPRECCPRAPRWLSTSLQASSVTVWCYDMSCLSVCLSVIVLWCVCKAWWVGSARGTSKTTAAQSGDHIYSGTRQVLPGPGHDSRRLRQQGEPAWRPH